MEYVLEIVFILKSLKLSRGNVVNGRFVALVAVLLHLVAVLLHHLNDLY